MLLGAFFVLSGAFWVLLGASGVLLGASGGLLGRSWGALGRSWGGLGPHVDFGVDFGSVLAAQKAPKVIPNSTKKSIKNEGEI